MLHEGMQKQIKEFEIAFDENNFGDLFSKTILPYLDLKIVRAEIPCSILYPWNYYFAKLYNTDKDLIGPCLNNMIKHFNHLIKEEATIKKQGDFETKEAILTPSFCSVWFKTSTLVMIANMLHSHDLAKKIDEYLEKNYYNTSSDLKVYSFQVYSEKEA